MYLFKLKDGIGYDLAVLSLFTTDLSVLCFIQLYSNIS